MQDHTTGYRFQTTTPIGVVLLTCVLAFSPMYMGAGGIFEDDWTPPKPVGQPHAPAAQPAPAIPATQPAAAVPRLPIPAKVDQAHSRALLKELYAKQIADRSLAGRKKLARTLLDEAPKLADSPTDRFVLLVGAMDAAREAENLELCFQAADRIAEQYDVDGLSIKADAILKINLRGDSPATASDNVKAALDLIDPLLAADDFQTSGKVLALARPLAAHDRSFAPVVQNLGQAIEAARAAHDRLAPHFAKLKTAPEDPAANLAVGSYYCFSKGDWPRGLPLLAKGSDANLKQLATLELSSPSKVDDVNHLADGWWDISAKEPAVNRPRIRQHASSLYKTVVESATGLRRALVERRIADASADQTASATVEGKLASAPKVQFVAEKSMKLYPAGHKEGSFPVQTGADPLGPFDGKIVYFNQKTGKDVVYSVTSFVPVRQLAWKGAAMTNMLIEIIGPDGAQIARGGPYGGGNVSAEYTIDFPPTRRFNIRLHNEAWDWYGMDSMVLRTGEKRENPARKNG
jgi:hypothetical protein